MILKPNISAVLFPRRMVRQADLTRGRRRRDCQRSKCPGSVSIVPHRRRPPGLAQTTACKDTLNTVLHNFRQGVAPKLGLRPAEKPLRCLTMTEIVLRVRLLGGDHLDVVYDEADAADDIVEHIISTLAQDGGALRCKHGDRLIVLYARGVATVEVAPRGAVL
jgi:hypothetical protein